VTTSKAERDAEPENQSDTTASHPEEMRAAVDLAIGKSVSIKATVRATPAGLATAALLIAAILVPLVWLARAQGCERIRAG
jgi:hypothetical protein